MKNYFLILILTAVLGALAFDPALCLAGTVIEGGVFTEEKSEIPFEGLGGLAGESLPSELYPASDRYANAPLDKKIFVVGTDDFCYYAHFKMVSGKKTLIVYHQSKTYIENCLYQKKLMADPSGFALFERGGGECKPVYAESMEAFRKKGESALRVVNNTVAINHCVKETSSFGLAFRTNQKTEVEATVVELDTPVEKPVVALRPTEKVNPIPLPTPASEPKRQEESRQPVETEVAKAPDKPKAKPKEKTVKKAVTKPTPAPVAKVTPTPSAKPEETKPAKWESLFSEAKEKLEKLTKEEITPPAQTAPATPVTAATPKPKKETKSKPVAAVKKREAKPKAPRKVAAVAKPVKLPQFTIQVGSFATAKEAETLIASMKKTDSSLETFTAPAQVGGKTWYRVYVGRYSSKADVKADIDRIRALSSSAAFIQSLKTDGN